MSETNYERYFGTPEKAAELMTDMCDAMECELCPLEKVKCPGAQFGTYLSWMEASAE